MRRAGLEPVERAVYAATAAIRNMGVGHRRRDIGVAQQCLKRSDVVTALEQMRREAVTLMPRSA